MTTPDHQPPAPEHSAPESRDRIYRSPSGLAAGVLLLAIALWLGIDALVSGHGHAPWLALAGLILVIPLVIAFTLRPAVYANEERLRIRNPFRVIVLPWGSVASLRSGYSNEAVATSGAKYQLWAVPVSLRARKRAARQQSRTAAQGAPTGGRGRLGSLSPVPAGPARAQADQIMEDLRELAETHEKSGRAQGEPTVRWAYEVMAPAATGAVLLAILLATG
ncbi:membrane protein [Streptomyces hygroscopicus]|uniref:PH domain-containing protein n=1 Tax=Streptomyces hygroscopicus TaxID=1912 RepID=UPI002240DC33|nr:PH domain-containing protein [Streptomyces hygroscopicus]MCW7945736.1 membrane protein [Streptomyces hygroscopicus]